MPGAEPGGLIGCNGTAVVGIRDEFSPVLGGANAKARDEKQRKRIVQAYEPCRIRKAEEGCPTWLEVTG